MKSMIYCGTRTSNEEKLFGDLIQIEGECYILPSSVTNEVKLYDTYDESYTLEGRLYKVNPKSVKIFIEE